MVSPVTDPGDLVPRHKSDLEWADTAVGAGYPAVDPILGELLEWLQDYNWPVAHVLAPFLSGIGPVPSIVEHIRTILASDDNIWKYYLLSTVVSRWDANVSCVKELAGFDLDLAGAQYMYV